MPINESRGPLRPPGLTTAQKEEQEQALYGLGGNMAQAKELTFEDMERMRMLVAEHDRQSSRPDVLDINNPPKEPYVYRPFPKTIYDHKTGQNMVVAHEGELKQRLEKGWKTEPPPPPQES